MFVDLPAVGKKFNATDSFGSVESVKAASDVYSPVAGEVLVVNSVSSYYTYAYAIQMRNVVMVSIANFTHGIGTGQ